LAASLSLVIAGALQMLLGIFSGVIGAPFPASVIKGVEGDRASILIINKRRMPLGMMPAMMATKVV
jgi:hypothetical protein